MATQDDKTQTRPSQSFSPNAHQALIQQCIDTVDNFSEVLALHRWVYDALHAQATSDSGIDGDRHGFGMHLLFRWLFERNEQARELIRKYNIEIKDDDIGMFPADDMI